MALEMHAAQSVYFGQYQSASQISIYTDGHFTSLPKVVKYLHRWLPDTPSHRHLDLSCIVGTILPYLGTYLGSVCTYVHSTQ